MAPRSRTVKRVEFRPDRPEEIVGYMARLAAAKDGWINLHPRFEDDERSTTLGFFALFGGGGGGTTMCTWIPECDARRGTCRVSLGIAHTTGRRIASQLPSLALGQGWMVAQDHPRRGLVVHIPVDEPHEHVLTWAIEVVSALSPEDRARPWRAEVHLPAEPRGLPPCDRAPPHER